MMSGMFPNTRSCNRGGLTPLLAIVCGGPAGQMVTGVARSQKDRLYAGPPYLP